MLNLLRRGAPAFESLSPAAGWQAPADAVWLDLVNPTREEELAVEAALGLELPTAEEMGQIEPSSRLYQESGATFMTATLLARSDEGPRAAPVTFVLARGVLIDLRYDELRAFSVFQERAAALGAKSGTPLLLNLLDAVVERLAEILEQTGAGVEAASLAIFRKGAGKRYDDLLAELARAQSVTSMTRTSLVSLARLLSFASLAPEIAGDPECVAHLKSLQSDAQSLTEHAGFQSSHIAFLLDAALGLINIEQNAIIKFFSVVAVVFMPPTLVASIYGMNFHHMPELSWEFGYPMALVIMLATAVLPILWFKRRGWF
jgi:magnesium transporter